ncbi:hypothetical protein POTOM_035733 [Populus tomentosa]|uniref:Cellulose synthase-like protein G2 n=1 Tax=Populus tomentosa TaxID=118781 RepID=A0A8X8CEG1_POPTO|nr:hypothetical protein POTOM_035733 [Populus tomentosa]
MEISPPLHLCHVSKTSIFINRLHGLLHSIAIAFLIYYRASFLFQEPQTKATVPMLLWLLVFVAELLLSFIWLIGQAYGWHPVSRTVFPERLPEDDKLPAIDVFICTVDPDKEPTLEVMNTVLSAMVLDYPAEKLNLYLSDDGGAAVTLHGMKEAWRFAKSWLPFCKKYGIKTRCPKAYFSATSKDDDSFGSSNEFMADRQIIQEKYEDFKERVMRFREDFVLEETKSDITGRDHPALVEVIQDNSNEEAPKDEANKMPLLVYVSREKRPSHPHHFKAGALNVLLRVSGVISNSPHILVLDCDMYCNDPTSARQAMCFFFDPNISSSLAFVQFPQRFHNISKHDIYDSQLRSTFGILWQGLDGLKGPVLSGTGFYIKRNSLYGDSMLKGWGVGIAALGDSEQSRRRLIFSVGLVLSNPNHAASSQHVLGCNLPELRDTFGLSNEFVNSIRQNYKAKPMSYGSVSSMLLHETRILASCDYPRHTKWGEEACRFFVPFSRGRFLHRWSSGVVEVGLSKFCPLVYGTLRMSFLESLCYAEISLFPLFYCLPLWCFATIPQLCLLNGIPLYPKVSSSFFIVFSFIFLSAVSKHLYEVLKSGGSINTLVYEQRLWMMKSVSTHTYGSLDAVMKRIGVKEASFLPTNKAADEEKFKLYQMGKFDFKTSSMLLVPMVTVIILNMASFVLGVIRIIIAGNWDSMVVQVFLSSYILVMNSAIIEGMTIRKDKGCIPLSVTVLSTVFSIIFLCLGSFFLMY